MRLTCPTCGAEYEISDAMVPVAGRHVQCTACHTRWFVRGAVAPPQESEDEIMRRLEARSHLRAVPDPSRPRADLPPSPGQGNASAPSPIERPQAVAAPAAERPPVETLVVERPAEEAPAKPAATARPDEPAVSRPDEPAVERPSEPTATRRGDPGAARPGPAVPLSPRAVPAKPAERPMVAAGRPMASAERTALRPAPRLDLGAESPRASIPARPAPSRFGRGLLVALLLFAAALGGYLWRGHIAEAVPAAAPALATYGRLVDDARLGLAQRIEELGFGRS
jgi:predicted Zn finger-like uncharacterized protein